MLRFIILFVGCCLLSIAQAQDSTRIRELVGRIAFWQRQSDPMITNGNFISYISNRPHFKTQKKDDNIFFAALINFTLQQQLSWLPFSTRNQVDSIHKKTSFLYPHFKNRKGRLTYNFWRTDTAFRFPYTNWIYRIKKNTSLPDDMDDTVLSLLAQQSDSTEAAEAHAIMQQYVNKRTNSKTIEKNYRHENTYSVWYGKNFPPVYDVCVLSNILSFVSQYHLSWTSADSAALRVIIQAVQSGDFINKPIYVSPYYGSTTLILYHLARLMNTAQIPELEALKTKLITIAISEFAQTNDLLKKAVLSTAILKWGYEPPAFLMPESLQLFDRIEQSDMPFFIGNIPSYFSPFWKRLFTKKQWLIFYHYSPAFNDALFLEYLVLKNADSIPK